MTPREIWIARMFFTAGIVLGFCLGLVTMLQLWVVVEWL